jgi:hypothetical protein
MAGVSRIYRDNSRASKSIIRDSSSVRLFFAALGVTGANSTAKRARLLACNLCKNGCMPVIQVRDVPDHIYRRLAEQAASQRRSIAQQAIAALARGLDVEIDPKARRQSVLRAIQSRGRDGLPTLTAPVRLIREDRRR